jgi:hypothetical protein
MGDKLKPLPLWWRFRWWLWRVRGWVYRRFVAGISAKQEREDYEEWLPSARMSARATKRAIAKLRKRQPTEEGT